MKKIALIFTIVPVISACSAMSMRNDKYYPMTSAAKQMPEQQVKAECGLVSHAVSKPDDSWFAKDLLFNDCMVSKGWHR